MPSHAQSMLRAATALVGALLCAATSACTPDEPAPPAPATAPAPAPAAAPSPAPGERELLVFAAASLREAFTSLGQDFERGRPGVAVHFNFAGTQELRTQLEHGAVADLFASADTHHMDELTQAGRASGPVVFARNEPIVIVAKEAAAKLRSLSDLPKAERVVIGTPEVPIGRYALQILDRATPRLGADFRARVEAKVVSHELSVKQVLTKVRLGEAQAGFVYRTDARGVADVTAVSIPPELNVTADYPIALLVGAPHPGLARAFVELVLSNAGQSTLEGAGFLARPVAER